MDHDRLKEEMDAAPKSGASDSLDEDVEILSVDCRDDGYFLNWFARVSDSCDINEAPILRQIQAFSDELGAICSRAANETNPILFRAGRKSAIARLKAIFQLLRELDFQRHGSQQRVTVQHSQETSAVVPLPERTAAERYLEQYLYERVEYIERLADRCRQQAANLLELSQLSPSEMTGLRRGRRIGPDMRSWEGRFRDEAVHLSMYASRFRLQIEKWRKGHHQLCQVFHTTEAGPARRTIRKSPKFAIAAKLPKARSLH